MEHIKITEKTTGIPEKQGTQQSGGGGLYFEGGASLLATLALLQLQDDFLQAIETYGGFTTEQYKNQMTFSTDAGQQMQNAADDQAYGMYISGALTIFGGITTAGTMAVEGYQMKGLGKEMEAAQTKLTNIEGNLAVLDKAQTQNLVMNNGPQNNALNQENVIQKLETLRTNTTQHTQKWTDDQGELKPEYGYLQDAASLRTENGQLRPEFARLKEDLNKQRATFQEKVNSLVQKSNTQGQKYNMVSQVINQASTGTGQVANAVYTQKKGEADAMSQVDQTISQEQGGFANQSAQGREQAFQAANKVNDILEQLKGSERLV